MMMTTATEALLAAIDRVVGCTIDGGVISPHGRPGLLCSDDEREFVVWIGSDGQGRHWVNVTPVEPVPDAREAYQAAEPKPKAKAKAKAKAKKKRARSGGFEVYAPRRGRPAKKKKKRS